MTPADEHPYLLRALIHGCVACGWPTVAKKRAKEAQQCIPYLRPHAGRGLCSRCYDRAAYRGALIDFERQTHSRDELMDEYARLRREGYTRQQTADRLGVTLTSLEAALKRAGQRGDVRSDWKRRAA